MPKNAMFIHLATGRGFFMPNCRMYGGFMETIGNLWLYIAIRSMTMTMPKNAMYSHKLPIVSINPPYIRQLGINVSIKQAAYWSVAWVSVAALFGGGLWLYLQQTVGDTPVSSLLD
jgi:tellurite resistance protein TerC